MRGDAFRRCNMTANSMAPDTKPPNDTVSIALLGEIIAVDQLARGRIGRVLPKGMELSHFSVLNHLAHVHAERTPAELALAFNVTRGAMTNTLGKLEIAGYVHIRPDWDDARRKFVAISRAGMQARDAALSAMGPVMAELTQDIDPEELKMALPVLRELRRKLLAKD